MNWHGKRYYSFDSFLKNYFGEKIYKVSLDGGFTCPNRDGTLGTGGCIFCSEGGSGDFASSAALSVTDQITAGIEMVSKKIENGKYIPSREQVLIISEIFSCDKDELIKLWLADKMVAIAKDDVNSIPDALKLVTDRINSKK